MSKIEKMIKIEVALEIWEMMALNKKAYEEISKINEIMKDVIKKIEEEDNENT